VFHGCLGAEESAAAHALDITIGRAGGVGGSDAVGAGALIFGARGATNQGVVASSASAGVVSVVASPGEVTVPVPQTVWASQVSTPDTSAMLWKPSAMAEPTVASVEAESQTVWAVQEVPAKVWKPVAQAQVESVMAVHRERCR
jgi:hypothetical protein